MADRLHTPFTNEHFAAWCLSMIGQPYWFGTTLHKCTESLLIRKGKQYPSHYGSSRMSRYRQESLCGLHGRGKRICLVGRWPGRQGCHWHG